MSKKLLRYEILGFIIVSIVGSLLHFAYDWSDNNFIIAAITPVNESPWEHLKLIFFPFIVYSLWEYKKISKDMPYFYFSKYTGVICGIICILSIYYISTGVTGKLINIVNILSFFIGLSVAFLVSYLLLNSNIGNMTVNIISIILIVVTALVFIIFTFKPPLIPLFQDPQNLTYGIS